MNTPSSFGLLSFLLLSVVFFLAGDVFFTGLLFLCGLFSLCATFFLSGVLGDLVLLSICGASLSG
jgi:hypothetical protein